MRSLVVRSAAVSEWWPVDQGGCLAQEGAFVGGELAQALGQPGVAASPVGEEDLAALAR